MALKKLIVLPSGSTASYFRITSFRIDYRAKEASFTFDAYLADGTEAQPQRERAAKLRLEGSKFDQWFSKKTLKESDNDIVKQAYLAAKAEPVVSDFGASFLGAAEDV
jgi:hypothetical protein